MYVCVCNAITDTQVSASIEAGLGNAHEVHPHLGCQVRCGRCIPTIVEMMDTALNADPIRQAVAAE